MRAMWEWLHKPILVPIHFLINKWLIGVLTGFMLGVIVAKRFL